MGSYGVSEVGAGAGERVGGGSGFLKVTEGGLVRRSWVKESEERMWKPSLLL